MQKSFKGNLEGDSENTGEVLLLSWNSEGRTCEVQASQREEVLHVVVSQFHHDQADQGPADVPQKTNREKEQSRPSPTETPFERNRK